MKILRNALTVAAMLLLLVDSKTAFQGASEGIQLCLQSVIPSLFPFLFISVILTSVMSNVRFKLLQAACRQWKIPVGCESILLLAAVGGYPVGAQAVSDAWRKGQLDADSARRLMGFCNNAGPSFIFGILSSMFSNNWACWALWLIQITSSAIVGLLLEGKTPPPATIDTNKTETAASSLIKAIRSMSCICAWVILFRVMLVFAKKYVLFSLPSGLQILLCGMMELTNGCLLLGQLENEGLRFVLASVMLSWGGLCVLFQTRSVAGTLGTGKYFPGKLLQASISLILSIILSLILYPRSGIL